MDTQTLVNLYIILIKEEVIKSSRNRRRRILKALWIRFTH
jgi:hypothetical protein